MPRHSSGPVNVPPKSATFEVLENKTGHHISPRVLITLYAGRSPFVKAVVDEVHQHLAGQHFSTIIRQTVKLAEAASHGLPISQYAKNSVGFEDYKALADEVLREEAEEAAVEELAAAAPVVTRNGVVFTMEAPGAGRVQLAGDFNNWTPDAGDMEQAGRVWKKVLQLAPGRYRYRYVIDGRWETDPRNAAVEPSPYGGNDSLIVLEEPPTPAWVLPRAESNGSE